MNRIFRIQAGLHRTAVPECESRAIVFTRIGIVITWIAIVITRIGIVISRLCR